jgi:hypothetical protein
MLQKNPETESVCVSFRRALTNPENRAPLLRSYAAIRKSDDFPNTLGC